jgi:acyl carrier protein
MVPAAFVFLDALPLTPTGKLDRRALLAVATIGISSVQPYVAARTPLEEVVGGIWADVLEQEKVSVLENFFDLGGHSLLAAQIVSRVQSALKVDLPLASFFKEPTIAGVSASLLQGAPNRGRIEKTAELLVKLSRLSDNEVQLMLQNRRSILSEN